MTRTKVTFNGHDLTSRFLVSDLRSALLPRNIASKEVSGRDGSVFTDVTLSTRTIGMTLTAIGRTDEERQEAARLLASMLATDEPAPLELSIDGGLYYMAMAESGSDGNRYRNATSYDVTFTAHDPVAYGPERTVTVPSGGSSTFLVGGTYRTRPVVSVPAAANGNGGVWKLTLDGGDYLIATIPSGVGTAPIVADCDKRTLRVNSSVALLSPAADWLTFEPGQHTLVMAGTGAATVTFRERWL